MCTLRAKCQYEAFGVAVAEPEGRVVVEFVKNRKFKSKLPTYCCKLHKYSFGGDSNLHSAAEEIRNHCLKPTFIISRQMPTKLSADPLFQTSGSDPD